MRVARHRSLIGWCAAATALCGLAACFGMGEKVSPPVTVITPPVSKVEVKPVDLKPVCGTVRSFTPAEEKALAAAVTALGANNPIIAALGDYRRMREEARACRNFK